MLTCEIIALGKSFEATAVEARRMLHRIPEIQYEEFKTSGYIASMLDTLSIPYERGFAKGTGIVATIKGQEGGRCVGIRADIDALPIKEETNLSFKSTHENMMHACGHDAHIAIALSAAFILNELKGSFKGDVKIFFQPAEEGDGGAELMINEGVMENPKVDIVLGCHVMSEYKTGTVVYKKGPLMSSPDNFEITIYGTGGHGAYPEKCNNPLLMASEIILKLTSLTDPTVPRVVSVCTVDGGNCPNVIPSSVKLTGTARTFTQNSRKEVVRLIEDCVKAVCEKHNGEYDYNYILLYPALINDDAVTEAFKTSAEKIVGAENVIMSHTVSMAGDDFSYFSQCVPGTYVHIGCGNEEKGAIYPIHHPSFTVDEDCITIASTCIAQAVVDFLSQED